MATVSSVNGMAEKIARVAKREVHALIGPARKTATEAKREVGDLKRRMADLERQIAQLKKATLSVQRLAPVDAEPSPRYTARGVRAQRDRLGLSAEDFGRLLGVSSQAVYNWEHGTARPRLRLQEQMALLRKITKSEARARLKSLAAGA
jgi:DNA-binding transcriptional regulator YiaG